MVEVNISFGCLTGYFHETRLLDIMRSPSQSTYGHSTTHGIIDGNLPLVDIDVVAQVAQS